MQIKHYRPYIDLVELRHSAFTLRRLTERINPRMRGNSDLIDYLYDILLRLIDLLSDVYDRRTL
jgi:hypothetical protein